MIIVIDALNRDRLAPYQAQFEHLFHTQNPPVKAVKPPLDRYAHMNPTYVLCVDESGQITGGLRLMQTTGPHMLSDSMSCILNDEAPLRCSCLWEASQICLMSHLPASQAQQTLVQLLIGALELAKTSGILDIVALLNAPTNDLLQSIGQTPCDYLGRQCNGFVAALLDCSPDRIQRLRTQINFTGDIFMSTTQAMALLQNSTPWAPHADSPAEWLLSYCADQIATANNASELVAAEALHQELYPLIESMIKRQCNA